MRYIGIDMSKDSFHSAFSNGKVKKFANTKHGIEMFLDFIKQTHKSKKTLIGVEATGVYHLLFAKTLTKQNWKVNIINPLESHKILTQGLRTVKTDRIDAIKIREMVKFKKGYLFSETDTATALKALINERNILVQTRKAMKQRQEANKLKAIATGKKLFDSFSDVIKAIGNSIIKIEKEMKSYEQDTQRLLQTIPGVGPVVSASLVAYIGDIKRFDNPKKLVAYIGLDSRVYQSGTSIQGKGYISKKGNKYLRNVLFNSAFVARQYNPDLNGYYNKKIKEGKHYLSAMCAVERKLIHLIYAVWKRETPYVKYKN
jgi:transposase